MLRGILIDVNGELTRNDAFGAKIVEIEDTVENLQKLCHCGCIDIARRKIGGKYYEIVCDDEGLLQEEVKPSAIGKSKEVMLVGNLFIVGKANSHGELTSLSEKDCESIMQNVGTAYTRTACWPVLKNVEY